MSRKRFSRSPRTRRSSGRPSASSPRASVPLPVGADRPRRADARHDVLALRVREELAVEHLLARRRVPRERDAGGRVLAEVAEDHRLHVDRRPPGLGDAVQLPIGLRALVVPGAEDRADRAPELLPRVLRDGLARLLPDDLVELVDEAPERRGRQLGVGLDAFSRSRARASAFSNGALPTPSTTSPYICVKRRQQS